MKFLRFSIAAALVLASQVAPASAYSTASPYVKIVPFSPRVAVAGAPARCNAPAAIDGDAYFEMPTIAAVEGVSGLAQVKIDLTSAGNLASAQMFSSSGNRWLDRAALLSARLTRFTAETVSCERVAGSYLYEVEF
jgi:TonB family protein